MKISGIFGAIINFSFKNNEIKKDPILLFTLNIKNLN